MRRKKPKCGYKLDESCKAEIPGAVRVADGYEVPAGEMNRFLRSRGLLDRGGDDRTPVCLICGPLEPEPGEITLRCDPARHAAYYAALESKQ